MVYRYILLHTSIFWAMNHLKLRERNEYYDDLRTYERGDALISEK